MDGTENHCVNWDERMKSARRCGNRLISGGTRWSCAPAAKVAKISKVERSKWSGECPDSRSDAVMEKYRHAHSTNAITLAWLITTPFGVPVDPDVNRMCAAASCEFRDSIDVVGPRLRSSSVKRTGNGQCAGGGFRSSLLIAGIVVVSRSRERSSSTPIVDASASTRRPSHDSRIFASRSAGLDPSSGTKTQSAL